MDQVKEKKFSVNQNTESLLSQSNFQYDPFTKESRGRNRSTLNRLFGKIDPDSMRGAIITLVTAAIGLGLLTYPKAYSFYGYVLGSIAITYAALCTTISYSLLASVCGLYPNHSLYSELVSHFLGRFWSKYTAWIFIFYYIGACIGYVIVIVTFFKEVLGSTIAGWMGKDYTDSFKKGLGLMVTMVLMIVLFSGTIMRRAGIIRYLGILVVLMVVYLTLVTIIQAHAYVEEFEPHYEPFGPKRFYEYILQFGLLLFAFNGVPAYHQVYIQVKLPTVRRMKKIGIRVSLFLWTFYMLFTIAAYISLGNSMQDSKFDLFPNKHPLSSDPQDILMKILKIGFIVCLISTYLVNAIPLKAQIIHEFEWEDETKNHIFVSFGISLLIGLLSYFYPNVTNWLGILGSLGSTSMIVLLPTLCYCKGYADVPKHQFKIKLVKIWCGVTTFMSFLCLVATIANMQGYTPTW